MDIKTLNKAIKILVDKYRAGDNSVIVNPFKEDKAKIGLKNKIDIEISPYGFEQSITTYTKNPRRAMSTHDDDKLISETTTIKTWLGPFSYAYRAINKLKTENHKKELAARRLAAIERDQRILSSMNDSLDITSVILEDEVLK